jgi:Fic family protein
MAMHPTVPKRFPFKLKSIPPYLETLGKTHAAVARMDISLSLNPYQEEVLYALDVIEASETLYSQKLTVTLEDFWAHQLSTTDDSSQLQSLQKIQNMVCILQTNRVHMRRGNMSLQYILSLHKQLHHGDKKYSGEVGHLRKWQNWIGAEGCPIEEAYQLPPAPQRVPKLMRTLCAYMRMRNVDPLLHTALCFAQLLIIHPFMDGNGRIARILTADWIYKNGLTSTPCVYFSRYCRQNRADYMMRFFEIAVKDAWEEWIQFFLEGIVEECALGEKLSAHALFLDRVLGKELPRYSTAERRALMRVLLRYPILTKNTLEDRIQLPLSKRETMIAALMRKKWIRPYGRSHSFIVPRWLNAVLV